LRKGIVILSTAVIILGIIVAYIFGEKMDAVGTYESIYLLYMLIGQGICGLGIIGLVIGLSTKKPDEK